MQNYAMNFPKSSQAFIVETFVYRKAILLYCLFNILLVMSVNGFAIFENFFPNLR